MSWLSRISGILCGGFLFWIYFSLIRQSSISPKNDIINKQLLDLPEGFSAEKACSVMKEKIKRIDDLSSNVWAEGASSLSSSSSGTSERVEKSIRFYWKELKCNKLYPSNRNVFEDPEDSTSTVNSGASSFQHTSHRRTEEIVQNNIITKDRCREWMNTHHVVSGHSWGTLPLDLQKEWSTLLCDKYTDTATSTSIEGKSASASATITEGTGATLDSSSNQKKDEDHLLLKLEKEKRQRVKGDTAALPQIPQQNIDWCFQAREKYNVQPLKSWGQLPMNMIESWGQRQCDLAFTAARMSRKPLATCIGKTRHASGTWIASVPIDGSSSVVPQQSAAGKVSTILTSLFGNRFSTSNSTSAISKSATATATATSGSETYSDIKSLPLIAIMAASTTRRIKDPSTSNLALFTLMLPSLIRTLDCGYRYMYVLGFDKGDPFYDSDEGMSKVKKWFKTNIELPLKANGIFITLETVQVNNSIKKPGPVFLEMARKAYDIGADYFYRVNDDTEMKDPWPALFVHSLQTLGKPFGVIGPKCNQGNQKILTHDFTSRLHMEIFEMNYYPPQLVDWWMDDWISYVYGKKRTFKGQQISVLHHTGAHGQRYEVDRNNEALLVNLIQQGKNKIRKWMLQEGPTVISEDILREFDTDVFEANYDHSDIPVFVEPSTGLIMSSKLANTETTKENTQKVTDISTTGSDTSKATSATMALLDSVLNADVQEDKNALVQGRGGRGVRRQRANRKGKRGNKMRLGESDVDAYNSEA